MIIILALWLILLFIFSGVPGLYYLYLRRATSRLWNLKYDPKYSPPVTVIIPTHNEEKTIRLKLENLEKVNYPKEKMQTILVDDASTDGTVEEVNGFSHNSDELNIEVLQQSKRVGKSKALNEALKHAKNDIIIMSDADAFLDANILNEALPYLADPSVGAVVGRQRILNSEQSWVTQAEKNYLDFVFSVIRCGESKIHSTIIFHGSFGAYKRRFLTEFNVETDDSGTALDIVQKGGRTICVRDAFCFDVSPVTWKGRVSTKVRRASQLVQIWGRCLKLLVKGKLLLPKKIAVPEVFMYLINPVIFVLFALVTILLILSYLPYSLVIPLTLFIALLIPKTRFLLVELLQDNCILLRALFTYILGKKFIAWNPLEESRLIITRDLLKSKNLI